MSRVCDRSAASFRWRTEACLQIATGRHRAELKNGKVCTGMGASSSERMRGFEAAEGSGERQFMSTMRVERGGALNCNVRSVSSV